MHEEVLKVSETFLSIQGESTFTGLPCFFIRLAGCNLRCHYCDTRYAYEEEGYKEGIGRLVSMARDSRLRLVEITGGEPLLQEHSLLLIKELCDRGFTVLVETNGSRDISPVDPRAVIILDVKTPGSGFSEMMDLENLKRLRPHDEVKFVITDRADYDWTKALLERYNLHGPRVLLSPAKGYLKPQKLSEWIIMDRLDVRLNLQIHKIIFGDRRGV